MPSEIDIFRDYMSTDLDVSFGTPATAQEIEQFEVEYDIRLPADVREYFLKINGVYISGGFISLYPLHEWKRVIEYPLPDQVLLEDIAPYFVFGNYDISVWHWLILLSPIVSVETPIMVRYQHTTNIAATFTEFLRLYRIEDPIALLGA
jgi:hypothetical protein